MTYYLSQSRGITLAALERDGLVVEASYGPKLKVEFTRKGEPERAWRGTGWMGIWVRSNFGGETFLLFEENKNGRVSGLVRLKGGRR